MLWMAFRRVVVDIWVGWGPPRASDAIEYMDIRLAMVGEGDALDGDNHRGLHVAKWMLYTGLGLGCRSTVESKCNKVDCIIGITPEE